MPFNRTRELSFIDDPEIAAKTEQRLVKVLFQNSEFSLLALIVLCLAFFWVFSVNHAWVWPTLWASSIIGLVCFRVVHIHAVLKSGDRSKRLRTCVNTYLILASLTALIWSSGVFFFADPDTHRFLSFYTLVSVGITCVAISSQAPIPRIYPYFQFFLLLPLAGFHVYLGGIENYVLGVTAICFMGFGIILSRRIRRSHIQSIYLELTNEKLVETLKTKNTRTEELNRNLVGEVRKRKITEEDLRVAVSEAHAASKAKSDFLAVVSHEIRTPMNGILGMFDLLTDTELDKIQQDYLNAANRSAETLLRLLNDLLDFSKTDQGGLNLEVSAFQIKEALEEIA
ncbi:MAG: hypothetical protein KJT03_01265, partial [Verrucomicrobiae bacterium]|nr:hypothetical protein [Verrucomicrobiae bacterium]